MTFTWIFHCFLFYYIFFYWRTLIYNKSGAIIQNECGCKCSSLICYSFQCSDQSYHSWQNLQNLDMNRCLNPLHIYWLVLWVGFEKPRSIIGLPFRSINQIRSNDQSMTNECHHTSHCLKISDHFIGNLISSKLLNTLRPRQDDRHFADDTFNRIFVNENVRIWIEFSLKFVPKGPINNIPALVQIMAWRRWGDKPLSEVLN